MKLYREMAKKCSTVICCDGAAGFFIKHGIAPDYCIGDFDSIPFGTAAAAFPSAKVIHRQAQTETDLEKAIILALKLNAKEAFILGAFGLRADHFLSNTALLLKYHSRISIELFSDVSVIVPCAKQSILTCEQGETISIFGFGNNVSIRSKGLRYPLRGRVYDFGGNWSISNVAVASRVELTIEKGKVLVVRPLPAYLRASRGGK